MAVEKIRKTGKDYRKEYVANKVAYKSISAHVDSRLRELVKLYPDAIVSKAARMKANVVDNNWLDSMSTELKISFIENIEQWSEEQQGVQQLKI